MGFHYLFGDLNVVIYCNFGLWSGGLALLGIHIWSINLGPNVYIFNSYWTVLDLVGLYDVLEIFQAGVSNYCIELFCFFSPIYLTLSVHTLHLLYCIKQAKLSVQWGHMQSRLILSKGNNISCFKVLYKKSFLLLVGDFKLVSVLHSRETEDVSNGLWMIPNCTIPGKISLLVTLQDTSISSQVQGLLHRPNVS